MQQQTYLLMGIESQAYCIITIIGWNYRPVTYRLSLVSRPLAGMHFQKPKYLDFTVDASQTYFIKYDEEK